MTEEEILRTLRICGNTRKCTECPLGDKEYCLHTMTTCAAELIEQLKAKIPRWIPVTEKIPPDPKAVLVLTRSKNGVRNVDKGYWAIDHFVHRGCAEVTHWMPLPECPEEVTNT